MDPATAIAIASVLKLTISGAMQLAEQAGLKPEEIAKAYDEAKVEYAAAKKALG
jgi:hypothetical protein